jgi:signal transduction histidine kinase
MEIVKEDAHEKGIVLERDFHAAKSGLIADPSRIQQVIWNLLRNAVKFTPKGGKICIRTSDDGSGLDGSHLRIEVSELENSGLLGAAALYFDQQK